MNAAALIVGVNDYDHLSDLPGCIDDAVDAVKWIAKQGVDPRRIRLHVSNKGLLPQNLPTGLSIGDAQWDSITKSLSSILSERGEKLFIFFSGHGLYSTSAENIFLASDFDRNRLTDRNIPIRPLVTLCLASDYRDTLIVLDSCLNTDKSDPTYRSIIVPGTLGKKPGHIKSQNAVLVMMAAGTNHKAPIIGKRGLLTNTLLTQVDKVMNGTQTHFPDVCDYNWDTGEAHLDLIKLFELDLQPLVKAEAQRHSRAQTPEIQRNGRLNQLDVFHLGKINVKQPLFNEIKVNPAQGTGHVRIEQYVPHYVTRVVYASELTGGTLKFATPQGAEVEVHGRPAPGWKVQPVNGYHNNPLNQKRQFDFKFSSGNASTKPASAGAAMVFKGVSAGRRSDLPKFGDMKSLGAKLSGVNLPVTIKQFPQSGDKRFGILIDQDPKNPFAPIDLPTVKVNLEKILKEESWWGMLEAPYHIPEKEQTTSRVTFGFARENATALYRFLADRPIVKIDSLDHRATPYRMRNMPSALESFGALAIDPGRYRVSVDLPWGRSIQTVNVGWGETTAIELGTPESPPPLRYRFQDRPNAGIGVIVAPLGLTGLVSLGQLLHELPSPSLADYAACSDVIVLLKQPDTENGLDRLEAFGTVEHEAWDYMFGKQDLGSVNVDDAFAHMVDSDFELGQTSLFALGLSYAAWFQRGLAARSLILDCMDILNPGFALLPDVALLKRAVDETVRLDEHPRPLMGWGLDLLREEEREPQNELKYEIDSSFAEYLDTDNGSRLGSYIGKEFGAIDPYADDPLALEKKRQIATLASTKNSLTELIARFRADPQNFDGRDIHAERQSEIKRLLSAAGLTMLGSLTSSLILAMLTSQSEHEEL